MLPLKILNSTPQALPATQTQGQSVIVRKGDTLKEIADRQKVPLEDLLKANPQIKDANKIQVGQEIFLPSKEKAKPEKLPDLPPIPQTRTSQITEDKLKADLRAVELHAELDKGVKPKTDQPKVTDQQKVDEWIGKSDRWDANKMTDQLFYERHPDLKGKQLAKGSAEAKEWIQIKNDVVEPQIKKAVDKKSENVKTNWTDNLHSDSKDNAKTDEIFYQRHPDLKDKQIKKGSAEAKEWKEIHKEVVQNKYNDVIGKAVKEFPGLDPKVLKSLLVTESRFEPGVVNHYGYAGIAQFGKGPARSVGLKVNSEVDERLDPEKAIPGAARHLKDKATYLENKAFEKYGKPTGDEYWKFVLAAYNGGEGTVTKAMEHAYNNGLKEANDKGLTGDAAVNYAKQYATQWDNLRQPADDIKNSPLHKATSHYFSRIAEEKYNEIGKYPVSIMKRANQ